jgi:hypothetical protein
LLNQMTDLTSVPHLRMVVLAPAVATIPQVFERAAQDPITHQRILSAMQQMRGRVALREGAVKPGDLAQDGRFRMPGDEDSWHLIRMDADDNVKGCARVLVHPNTATFPQLRLASSAVAHHPEWGGRVRQIVESDLQRASEQNVSVVEPGGWVLEERLRGTSEAILIALSAFAWARFIGTCLAYVTATVKHHSSLMLRRLGAQSLYFGGEEVPKYYDSRYSCEMELLRLQSEGIHPRFESRLSFLYGLLSTAPMFQAGPLSRSAAA